MKAAFLIICSIGFRRLLDTLRHDQKSLDPKGSEIVECRRRIGTLITPWPGSVVVWDFLYFSIITQSTVGYGDILPNRTLIRIFVSLQILWGLVLLVVAINLV
jgi:hypothetical protein